MCVKQSSSGPPFVGLFVTLSVGLPLIQYPTTTKERKKVHLHALLPLFLNAITSLLSTFLPHFTALVLDVSMPFFT